MEDVEFIESGEIPDDLRELIKPELRVGEKLIWAGRGGSRLNGTRRVLVGKLNVLLGGVGGLVVGSLLLAAHFSAFGKLQIKPSDEIALLLGGSIAVVVGFLLLVFFCGTWYTAIASNDLSRRPYYGLTDQRIILWEPTKDSDHSAIEVRSFARSRFRDVHRKEYPDGSGDVVFDAADPEGYWIPCLFSGVREVRRVELLLREFFLAQNPGRGGEDTRKSV